MKEDDVIWYTSNGGVYHERKDNAIEKNVRVFQGCRGKYTGGKASLHLKEGAQPYWAKPYPIPLKNRVVTEEEVYRQCDIGALRQLSAEEIEDRRWSSPAFGVIKKDGTIRLVMDFRELNKWLKRKQYPLSTIEEQFSLILGFLYGTVINLNM